MSITREEAARLAAESKLNFTRLESCTGPHEFTEGKPGTLQAKYTCSKCRGQVSNDAARWYRIGLEHGGKL